MLGRNWEKKSHISEDLKMEVITEQILKGFQDSSGLDKIV